MTGGWVYILCNRRNGALYIGVTADLARRVWLIEETNPDWRDLWFDINR